ncbi:unnamed protein product [Staurois parvus]|uniref:NAD(P)(+)--arginine ADP-ribosyltransferase n=1 Tax=Staurois parvus TaxID=386267 RepID=A0ABN9H236_9NEOB|nr:unnamed protein product [Staurois parvus]
MMSNAFDDQYLGCARQMEREMAKVLEQEKKYRPLAIMWYLAEQRWAIVKQSNIFPPDFKDEYGISLILYTKESPFPIYQQLNRNVSIAGRSRQHYMDRFHFKALHFYLTRALQVLGGGCGDGSQAYRGSWMKFKNVSSDLRFGQFASSSLSRKTAQRFGINTMFTIFTCFGVNVESFSDFMEEEVLIPVAETFHAIKTSETLYVLRSSGQQCSYYNCAYLGGEQNRGSLYWPDVSTTTSHYYGGPSLIDSCFSYSSPIWHYVPLLATLVVLALHATTSHYYVGPSLNALYLLVLALCTSASYYYGRFSLIAPYFSGTSPICLYFPLLYGGPSPIAPYFSGTSPICLYFPLLWWSQSHCSLL